MAPSTLMRVDGLDGPPVVGQAYLVPAITAGWHSLGGPLAVHLPAHEDQEHLGFRWWHYHVDGRFLTPGQWRSLAGGAFVDPRLLVDPWLLIQRYPVAHSETRNDLPAPIWVRRRCYRPMAGYGQGDEPLIVGLRQHYAGRRCGGRPGAWVCPHKGLHLATIPPVDGVLTCPMHGLRICAATGRVLPAEAT